MNLDLYRQKGMKIAKVYMHDKWAGNLTEDEDDYHFQYEKSYLDQPNSMAISVSFPLTSDRYESKIQMCLLTLHFWPEYTVPARQYRIL